MGGVCSVHYRHEKCATKIFIKGTTHSGRIMLNAIGVTWLITLGGGESAMGINNSNVQRRNGNIGLNHSSIYVYLFCPATFT